LKSDSQGATFSLRHNDAMTEILLTQAIEAPLERVWQACSEVRGLTAWQADEASGEMVPGRRVELRWPALGVSLPLDVHEVLPERRIVLGAGRSRLTLALTPGEVTLSQDGVGEGDEAEGVRSSWRLSLALLAHYCERHAGARRAVRWLLRPARTSAATAHVFFTEPSALAGWLGSGSLGPTGARFTLDLVWGERMTGRVLSSTPGRDVSFTWDEDDSSVICLRTLPRPFSEQERWIVLSWSRWSASAPPRERLEALAAAHRRLVAILDAPGSA
jgi:uncharacterized protein YndB with AHSA1/START domain